MCLPLGINKDYLDQFDADSCQLHDVFTQWDISNFANLYNDFQPNHVSLSFVGWDNVFPPYIYNYLHADPDSAKLDLSFRVHAISDTGLINQTVCDALVPGWDTAQGWANAGDSLGSGFGYEVMTYYACVAFSGGGGSCDYVVGDVNGSDTYNGLDITYGVSYFKAIGPAPQYECECTPGNTWYVSGDVNGDCNYNGLDVGYGVNYFKGGPLTVPCPDCPPPVTLVISE